MAMELWIDKIADIFASIDTHDGRKVRAYKLVGVREVPDELTEFPCAVPIPQVQGNFYSKGSSHDLTAGMTELHLFPDLKNSRLPDIVPYFARIRDAFAANLTLGGLVEYCVLLPEESIKGPVSLQYGTQDQPHWGLVINWQVKEFTDGELSVEG